MSTTLTTYTVRGMTCDHCARAVRDELVRLDGVRRVEVDLTTGRVTVEAARVLTGEAVRAAIDEAGYELVP